MSHIFKIPPKAKGLRRKSRKNWPASHFSQSLLEDLIASRLNREDAGAVVSYGIPRKARPIFWATNQFIVTLGYRRIYNRCRALIFHDDRRRMLPPGTYVGAPRKRGEA